MSEMKEIDFNKDQTYYSIFAARCSRCNSILQKIWFIQKEYDHKGIPTGREKKAVSHLLCNTCGKEEIIDGSFDGEWYFPERNNS